MRVRWAFLCGSVPFSWHAILRYQVVILANFVQAMIFYVHEGTSSYRG